MGQHSYKRQRILGITRTGAAVAHEARKEGRRRIPILKYMPFFQPFTHARAEYDATSDCCPSALQWRPKGTTVSTSMNTSARGFKSRAA